jgi:hypothetical protein
MNFHMLPSTFGVMKKSNVPTKAKSTIVKESTIQTPVPPQIQYPQENPDSKKNQQTKPGNESTKNNSR